MNARTLLIGFFLLLRPFPAAGADHLDQGFHGMQWGSSINRHKHLVQVHSNAPAVYYSNADVAYQVSGTQVSSIIYGFYHDQFFAAFIKLKTPVQFSNLKRHFSTRYGQPKTTYHQDNGLAVYRWKDGNIKIKLKLKDTAKDMKLAIYYVPLAAKLNREQLERIPKDSWNLSPGNKDKTPQKEPLLTF